MTRESRTNSTGDTATYDVDGQAFRLKKESRISLLFEGFIGGNVEKVNSSLFVVRR